MVLRYVEGNPVRAGLVKGAKDWLWSSHKARIVIRGCSFIDEPPIEIPKWWDKYVNEPLTDNELERLRQSVNRQSPYGDSEWQVKITEKLGLESTLRPIGRPKKKKDDDKK
ncbi:MAG: hypothetical protein NC817_00090 [Candidatus Omnitrophica bacterium]|nr:hypothetical protein [Candidatus Omnitrophota bacterium]MCM8823588.1 hypothetical protein [Candidatus Omnitrophota bacterium]MCM8831983.1 hypothetical protein [Candidatus Omnitrophota bacterium]